MESFLIALAMWFVCMLNHFPRVLTFFILFWWTFSGLTVLWFVGFWLFVGFSYVICKED